MSTIENSSHVLPVFRRLILAVALVLPATGCAAGIHTGIKELHPAAAPVYAERIAVLPVTAVRGSEAYREVIGDSLLRVAERVHPGVEFVDPEIALEMLNEAGLAERFATLLLAYQETGIYDQALLRQVGEALQVDHVLQLKVDYEVRNEVGTKLFDPGELYEANRQNLHVSVVLWDVRQGVLAWEAAGSSTTRDAEYELPRSFFDVVTVTATRVAEQIPIAVPAAVEEESTGG
ncbi:MAG TPA: hypothetical protein VK689_08205 [Armatimonadota bacterium]|nr:hypothetical protein [Armatimonadota bacterium]